MKTRLFDSVTVGDAHEALDFLTNILESSTEYSIIGKDLNGNILLWNEGARRLYGYEPEEVVGKVNATVLHTPENVQAGKQREILENALRDGKWEGMLQRMRKNGERFSARVIITPATAPPVDHWLLTDLERHRGEMRVNQAEESSVGS